MNFSESQISEFSKMKTPFYYYDLQLLQDTIQALKEANEYGYVVHYALKANSNDEILKLIIDNGLGADCVSGNEIKKAVASGFSNQEIAFAGVGKTDDEIYTALDNDIFCFNCESVEEIEVINSLAKEKGKIAQIALRINPNVNAKTHHYITTGIDENKFGINPWELESLLVLIKELKNIKLIGLHFHIGSQITDLSVYKGLCIRVNEIQQWFGERNIYFDHINVGGGLGIDYKNPDENKIPDFNSYFGLFNEFLELRPDQQLHFELGRSIVGQCASLITRVLYVKKGVKTNFAIVDAGMTELLRPALYQAYHKVNTLTYKSTEQLNYDVVGPICESSDCFGKHISLNEISRGDLLAIRSVGAYGQVMSNEYNLRDRVNSYYR